MTLALYLDNVSVAIKEEKGLMAVVYRGETDTKAFAAKDTAKAALKAMLADVDAPERHMIHICFGAGFDVGYSTVRVPLTSYRSGFDKTEAEREDRVSLLAKEYLSTLADYRHGAWRSTLVCEGNATGGEISLTFAYVPRSYVENALAALGEMTLDTAVVTDPLSALRTLLHPEKGTAFLVPVENLVCIVGHEGASAYLLDTPSEDDMRDAIVMHTEMYPTDKLTGQFEAGTDVERLLLQGSLGSRKGTAFAGDGIHTALVPEDTPTVDEGAVAGGDSGTMLTPKKQRGGNGVVSKLWKLFTR